jgi:hypothetical protein
MVEWIILLGGGPTILGLSPNIFKRTSYRITELDLNTLYGSELLVNCRCISYTYNRKYNLRNKGKGQKKKEWWI